MIIFAVTNTLIYKKVDQYSNERIQVLRYANDTLFSEMNNLAYTISSVEQVKYFSNIDRDFSNKEKYDFLNVFAKKYNEIIINRSAIVGYYVYLPKTDYLLSYNMLLKSREYFESLFTGDEAYNKLDNFLKNDSSFALFRIINDNNRVFYKITAKSQGINSDFLIIYELNPRLLNEVPITTVSTKTLILNADDEIIFSNHTYDGVDLSKYKKIKSNVANVSYAYILDNDLIITDLKTVLNLVALALFVVLLALYFGVFFSFRMGYSPLKKIKDILPHNRKFDDNHLVSQVESICKTNANIRKFILDGNNMPNAIGDMMFNEILSNKYSAVTMEELEKNGISLDNQYLCVFICQYEKLGIFENDLNNIKETNKTISFSIFNVISELLNSVKFLWIQYENGLIILAISNKALHINGIRDVVKRTNSLFKREFDIRLFTGIGATVLNKNELALSHEQALNAANSLKLSGIDGVQFYSELSDSTETDLLFLVTDDQLNFENMILRGDEYSRKYLEGLFQRYVERHNLSYTYISQFMRAINSLLIGTLHTFHSKGLLSTNEMNNYFNLLMECKTLPELKSISFELTNHLINSIDKAVIPPENINITMAKEYIALNYSNILLSNTMIADACNISDSYLSFIFKTKTGVNLNNYISEYRIDKAVELMENNDMLIRDVVIACGISSTNSFYRLFKKYKGMSPQEFRINKT